MSERDPIFIQEDIVNAHKFLERIKERVAHEQLTDKHLQSAQDYLLGVESYKPHQLKNPARPIGRSLIELRKHGQIAALRVGITADLPSKEEEEQKGKVTLTINATTRELTIDDKETKVLNPIQFAVLREVATSPLRRLSASAIAELSQKLGQSSKFPARDIVKEINRKLLRSLHEQNLIIRAGATNNSLYLINPIIGLITESEGTEKNTLEPPKTSELSAKPHFILELATRSVINKDDGSAVGGLEEADFEVLIKIIQSQEAGLSSQEISHLLQQRIGETFKGQSKEIISRLRNTLDDNDNDRRIITQSGRTKGTRYFLNADVEIVEKQIEHIDADEEFSIPSIVNVEDTQSVGVSAEQVGAIQPTFPTEATYIPYLAGEDEKRSSVENRTLEAVCSAIRPDKRVDYEALQRGLYSEESISQTPTGKKKIKVRLADEIIPVFESAFAKIREEAEIPALRAAWTDEDRHVWEELDKSIRRVSFGDIAQYGKKLRREIRRSERKYYLAHRSKGGGPLLWIEID